MDAKISPYDTVRVVPASGGLAAALTEGYREVREIDQPAAVNGIVLISTSGVPVSMDTGARRAANRILSDGQYQIRVSTMRWTAGISLATQLANSLDLPRPQ
ncbi:MAG: hypothetical protein FJW31_18365 [Acidobacteria bacterium]|nr:hypothetical protein [Acidobacteriota bacterium]